MIIAAPVDGDKNKEGADPLRPEPSSCPHFLLWKGRENNIWRRAIFCPNGFLKNLCPAQIIASHHIFALVGA